MITKVTLAVLGFAISTIGCDPGTRVTVINKSDRAVQLFWYREPGNRTPDLRLKPLEEQGTGWIVSDLRSLRRPVFAVDENGVVIYCRVFTAADALKNKDGTSYFIVEVVPGMNDCK